jgi:hypothetical protein
VIYKKEATANKNTGDYRCPQHETAKSPGRFMEITMAFGDHKY